MTRDFKNFREFPGEIFKNGQYAETYAFPELKYKDIRNRERFWRMYIRIIDGKQRKMKQNWDIDEFKILELNDEHFDSKYQFPPSAKIQMWTESGIEGKKRSRSSPTYVLKGKNLEKKNATSMFTQALINGRSIYCKRKDKMIPPHGRYFPQSLHKYDVVSRDPTKNIVYPAAVQLKYDGVRAISFWDSKSNNLKMYSRGLKDFPINNEIRRHLNIIFGTLKNRPTLYLDGELFEHKMHLQEIVGYAKKPHPQSILKYYIFDCFDTDKPDLTFEERYEILENIFYEYLRIPRVLIPKEYLIFVKCKVLDKKEEDALYKKKIVEMYVYSSAELRKLWIERFPWSDIKKQHFQIPIYNQKLVEEKLNKKQWKKYVLDTKLSQARNHFHGDPVGYKILDVEITDYEFAVTQVKFNKYEGTVIRNLAAPYEIGKTKEIRSYQIRKRKPYSTAEFAIWDYKEGKGKNKGVITWIMKNAHGKTFNADPNMDLEVRAKLYTEFKKNKKKFEKEYKGKLLTVKFFNMSRDGIPTQPKVLGERLIK